MNNCIICFKNKNDMIELTCKHEFCFKCLKKGVSIYNLEKCPLCRQIIINKDITYIQNYIKKKNIVKRNYITRNSTLNHKKKYINETLRNLALQFKWNNHNRKINIKYNIRILEDMCSFIYKNVWYIKKDNELQRNDKEEHYICSIIRCIKGFTKTYNWKNGNIWLYKFKEIKLI